MKQETLKSFGRTEERIRCDGETRIIGKDSLVEFLKNYRNGLKEYTDIFQLKFNNIIKEIK